MNLPMWTVCYNIVSKESPRWVGTGWEFFDNEADAQACYVRLEQAGCFPTKRPYHHVVDRNHLGAHHQFPTPTRPESVVRITEELHDLAWSVVEYGTHYGVEHRRKRF